MCQKVVEILLFKRLKTVSCLLSFSSQHYKHFTITIQKLVVKNKYTATEINAETFLFY